MKKKNTNPVEVLLVEDDGGVIRAVQWIFASLANSAEITVAKSLAEARKVLSVAHRTGHHFDAAILDGQLPDGNTTDGLLKEIRQQFPTAHMVAHSGNEEVFQKQMEICNWGVPKGTGNLISVIRKILEAIEDRRNKIPSSLPAAVAA